MAGLRSSFTKVGAGTCLNQPPYGVTFNAADGVPISDGPGGIGTSYAYDSIGRQVTTTQTARGVDANGAPNTCNGTLQRSYDMENHIISAIFTNYVFAGSFACTTSSRRNGNSTYGWGPNEHPVQILNTGGSQFQAGGSLSATLHWDGDSLLFTTDQNGNLTDVKVGILGDLLPSGGISVLERDWSGDVVTGHSVGGSLGMSIEDPYQQLGGISNDQGTPDSVTQQGPILQPASDGIWDGVSVIQGVRNHDPQTGTWTTPDAYPGEIQDPMSQKSYMWNRNNQFAYSDPSGFRIVPESDCTCLSIDSLRLILERVSTLWDKGGTLVPSRDSGDFTNPAKSSGTLISAAGSLYQANRASWIGNVLVTAINSSHPSEGFAGGHKDGSAIDIGLRDDRQIGSVLKSLSKIGEVREVGLAGTYDTAANAKILLDAGIVVFHDGGGSHIHIGTNIISNPSARYEPVKK
jgi:hypothetical protein